MADQATTDGVVLSIPDELKAKYPALIELMLGSQSMNDGERQYWVNLLPIMTPEQIQNLTSILENEKSQLQAIDQKYATAASVGGTEDERNAERRQKSLERKEKEASARKEEDEHTDSILSQIETHDSGKPQ